jgi:hypothetical protein
MASCDKLTIEALKYFSLARPIPFTLDEIGQWAATIERVVPDYDSLALCWLVDEIMAGRYEYKPGIQHVTIALQRIEKHEQGYRWKKIFPV